MSSSPVRHAGYSFALCVVAALTIQFNQELFEALSLVGVDVHSNHESLFIGIVAIFFAFILPLASVAAALVALTYSTIQAGKRWHRDRLSWIFPFAAAEGIALYFVGNWLSGLYGLDPPEAYWFVGSAMILMSFATPLVLVALTGIAVWRWRKARFASDVGGNRA